MQEFQQKILPAKFYAGLAAPYRNGTYVWGFKATQGLQTFGPYYPGFTVDATRDKPTRITYLNQLPLKPVLQAWSRLIRRSIGRIPSRWR